MKHKLKKILLLYLLSGMLFVSCSLEEDYATKKRYEEKMKISHVSFGELLKNKKFSTAYSKVLQQQSLTNKTVMEEQYQFTIANKPVKVIETESATSYTILINRAIDDVNSFENLIVQQFNSGETTANIIKYVPFQPATIESYFLNGDFNGNRTVTPIVYNDNLINSTNKITNICSTVCTTLCYDCKPNYSSEYQIPHPLQNGCPTKSISTSCDQVCVSYDDGGGSSSNPIDLTGGGGTGGTTGEVETPPNDSGNNNPIVTAPVLELEEENETPVVQIPPCEKLKNLFLNTSLKVKSRIINDLRPNIDQNPDGEKAVFLKKEITGRTGSIVSEPTIKNQVEIKAGGNYFAAIHTHPFKAFPMFSWSDVLVLKTLNDNLQPYNNDMASFLLVCKDQNGDYQTYAIVFDETSTNTIDNIFNDPENSNCSPEVIAEIMDERLEKKYAKEEELGSRNYERAFLKMMMGYNVSLYKANTNLNNWDKLSLSNLTGTNINTTPCN